MSEARFTRLGLENMSAEQRRVAEGIAAGPRQHALRGPYVALLHAAALCELVERTGAYLRYESSLPEPLREFIVLIAARHWNRSYVFHSHRAIGERAGLAPAIGDAVAAGRRPVEMTAAEVALYDFCVAMLAGNGVADELFERMRGQFGEQGIAETVGTLGHYCTMCFAIAADNHPLQDGATPLPALPR